MTFKLKLLLICLIITSLSSCKTDSDKSLTAQRIIDNTIEAAGAQDYENAEITFTFRGNTYKSTRSCDTFMLERIVVDSIGTTTRDVLSNDGLKRFENRRQVAVADSLVQPISDGVNSVHYFAGLPFGLNATAANKALIGDTKINGKMYHKVKVTFDEQGGGTDFQDIFLYWINKETAHIDYLAYSYEVNGGGIRFREAFNPRTIKGIRFVDYNNYKPASKNLNINTLDSLFGVGKLQLLSKIKTENVSVNLLNVKC